MWVHRQAWLCLGSARMALVGTGGPFSLFFAKQAEKTVLQSCRMPTSDSDALSQSGHSITGQEPRLLLALVSIPGTLLRSHQFRLVELSGHIKISTGKPVTSAALDPLTMHGRWKG